MTLSRDITKWRSLEYERYYDVEDYRMKPWRWSRFGAVMEAKLTQQDNELHNEQLYNVDNEGGQITLRIFRRMQKEVQASGGEFLVASLPCQSDLDSLRNKQKLPQEELIQEMKREFEVIAMEPFLLESGKGRDLEEFFSDSHYKGEFDAVVGEKIAEFLLAWRKSASNNSEPTLRPPGNNTPLKTGSR